MKHEAILLDMNGVLLDDEYLHEMAFRQVLEVHGRSLSPEEYKNYFAGRTDKEGFENYLASNDIAGSIQRLMEEKNVQYQKLTEHGVDTYEGVREFVEQAALKGLKLAVVTSSSKHEALPLLASLGVSSFLSLTVTAEDISCGKPSPEGYLKAAEELGVEPGKCLVIEDAPTGVLAAKSAGMECIAVTTTHDPQELGGADKIVSGLDPGLLTDV